MLPEPDGVELIDDDAKLSRALDALAREPELAIDCEFSAKRGKLALMQLATRTCVYVIDPLAIEHLDPILDLLRDARITKLAHSGDDDARVLYRQYRAHLDGLLDTQVLAGFCGFPYRERLDRLTSTVLGSEISKGLRVTDWSKRPLSKDQVDYAARDAWILFPLFDSLLDSLPEARRLDWARLESRALALRAASEEELPTTRWKSLSRFRDKPDRLLLAMRLHDWREQEAAAREVPLDEAMSLNVLKDIVQHIDSGERGLRENESVPKHIRRAYVEAFIALYRRPPTSEEDIRLQQLPDERPDDEDRKTQASLLMLFLVAQARKTGVARELLGGKGMIDDLLRFGEASESPLLAGWRAEVLGKDFRAWAHYRGPIDVRLSESRLTAELLGEG